MKKTTKVIGLLLAMAVFIGVMPITAFAIGFIPSPGGSSSHYRGSDMTYAVEGGNIFYDPETGTITGCNLSVTSANIPSTINGVSIKGIGGGTFYKCDKLKSVTIPSGVTGIIGKHDFYYCSSLEKIEVASGNTAYCSKDGVLYSADMQRLIKYPAGKKDTSFKIPEGVKTIDEYAFASCTNLKSVTIPSSMTEIGYGAFAYCSSLTSITIPSSVTRIYEHAFLECSSLNNIILSSGVKEIDMYAFAFCSSLTNITIPSSVTNMSADSFIVCDSLEKIEVASGNTAYCSKDGVLYSADMQTLIKYPAGKKDKAFSIPEGVTSLSDGINNTNLTSITIPSTLTNIYRFSSCSSLEKIEVASGNTAYCSKDGVLYSADMQTLIEYPAGKKDKAFSIPEGVTSVSGGFDCSNLTSITIPSSLTKVTPFTSYNLTALEKIEVASGNTAYCSKDGVLYSADMQTLIKYPAGKKDTSFKIPEGIKTINEYAFSNCSNLTSITMPSGLTEINGTFVFSGCSGLKNITIPEGITEIGRGWFSGCSSLVSITIPSSVTEISGYAFSNCSSLEKIEVASGNTAYCSKDGVLYSADMQILVKYPAGKKNSEFQIPEGVKETDGAFAGCSNLTSITVPSSMTVIDGGTFYNCSSLQNVTIPEGVEEIRTNAFSGCYNLKRINIPVSITHVNFSAIEDDAADYYGHSGIKDIYYAGTEEQWKNMDFFSIDTNSITVHYNSVWSPVHEGPWVVYDEENGWHYEVDGIADWTYTGFAENENGTWYVVDGKVNFDVNSVLYDSRDGQKNWKYVRSSQFKNTYTGIASNSNGWWRIENGIVNFNATGVYQNENGWWYVKGGQVQFGYTGIKNNAYGWWRIVNGKVDFGATGVYQNELGWWYCKGGQVQFNYTGVQNNANGWWKIEDGKVNFNFTGIASNANGKWYLKNGKVDFSKNGKVTYQGKTYTIKGGKVA